MPMYIMISTLELKYTIDNALSSGRWHETTNQQAIRYMRMSIGDNEGIPRQLPRNRLPGTQIPHNSARGLT